MLKVNNLIGFGAGGNLPFPAVGNLVGYWKFDENTGLTAYDSSPSGRNGTLSNSALWTSDGKINSGIEGDGTNYISLQNGTNIFGLGASHSVLAWLYIDDINAERNPIIGLNFRNSSSSASDNGGQVFIYRAVFGGLQARLVTNTTSLVGGIRGGFAPGIYLEQGWNCVGMARGTATMELYAIDAHGVYHEASTSSSGSFNFSNGYSTNFLSAYSATVEVLPAGAKIDEVALFNTQITKADFMAYYNFNKGNFL